MKNFLSAVYTEMSGRLKTPLLGTFALCWLFYNHDHVAKLFFSDNAQRLALIEETPFYWMSDVVIPAVLSLIYIFAIPFAQWLVDLAKYKLIEKRRVATQHAQLLEKYNGQMKVAEQQSKASVEYWQEYYKNNAENAGKVIVDLKSRVSDAKKETRDVEIQLRDADKNFSTLSKNDTLKAEQLQEAQSYIKELETKKDYNEKEASKWRGVVDAAIVLVNQLEYSQLPDDFVFNQLDETVQKMHKTMLPLIDSGDIKQSRQLQRLLLELKQNQNNELHDIFSGINKIVNEATKSSEKINNLIMNGVNESSEIIPAAEAFGEVDAIPSPS